MTREEQIREAAWMASMTEETIVREEVIKDGVHVGYKDVKLRGSERPIARLFFREGVKWADENPKFPWISVEERLPPRKDKDHPYSERVFVRYIERLIDQEYVRYSFDDLICVGKIKKWCRHETNNEHVTHWMPIPELPIESNE